MALHALLISGALALAAVQVGCVSQAFQADTQPAAEVVPLAQPPDELNQLVAPIALYPDALVAQIVAAASYPTEVVEADRWIQQNSALKGEELAKAVDSQPWDSSVKALAQFPSVLATMDKNLSWTSALGEAYVNQPQNVLAAVQVMRRRAQQAGNLKNTPQDAVTTEGDTIVIQPADPDIVYVPEYDPWDVYGDPLDFYPGWVEVPGAFFGPGIEFGVGVGIGVFGGFGWGWNHWGADWHHHDVTHDHDPYHSHSPTFVHHNGAFGDHGAAGFARPGSGGTGVHTNSFSGFNHGGVAGAYSSRGRASFGGGVHGGGGFHGGGFHGGGGGHR
jgi:uncharacterized membrane protein YgcG